MNIDFSHHAGFSAYVLLLMFSGVVMLGMASPVVKTDRTFLRVLNVAFGLGFVGYGFYLAFLFHGSTYVIFLKAFILPLLMIVNTARSARARSAAAPLPTTVNQPASASLPDQYPYSQGAYPQAPYAAPPQPAPETD